jgi:hypothetical protein
MRILPWFATSPTIIAEAGATIFASSIGAEAVHQFGQRGKNVLGA